MTPTHGDTKDASAPDDQSAEVAALGYLYTTERTDQTAHLSATLAIVAGSFVYIGVIAGRLPDLRSSLWLLAVPIPLWILAAFHLLLMANILNRNHSLAILEYRLSIEANVDHRLIGMANGRKVMDLNQQPWQLKVQSIITYLGMISLILACTVVAWLNVHLSAYCRAASGVAYLTVAGLYGLGWLRALQYLKTPDPTCAERSANAVAEGASRSAQPEDDGGVAEN